MIGQRFPTTISRTTGHAAVAATPLVSAPVTSLVDISDICWRHMTLVSDIIRMQDLPSSGVTLNGKVN